MAMVALVLALSVAGPSPARAAVAAAKKKKKKPTRRRATPATVPVSPKAREAARERVEGKAESSASLTIENPAALVPFFEQLRRHQNGEAKGPLRILHYGDSHTAADEWTGTLRNGFQTRFGDGGAGFTYAGRPWLGYRRLDVHSGATRGWRSEGLAAQSSDGRNGMGGVSVWTSRPNESIWLEAECRTMEIFYLQQPGGGRIEISDNGERVDTVSTSGEDGAGYLHYDAAPGLHRFEIRTLDRAQVRLFGWATENERGVTYETLGINGAQASIVMGWDENLLLGQVARRDPALIVLAYGTNEAGNRDYTTQTYREMYERLLQRLRKAAPTASILVVGPPDRMYRSRGKWLPYPRIGGIIEAQRAAALASGCAFYDLRAKMGGEGVMRDWMLAGLAQYDHVHLTSAGYHRIGAALFEDLMLSYGEFTTVREKLLLEEKANEPRSENP
jgi:lysophospholipase L1-like esterase